MLEHISNLGDTLGTLLGVCDLTVEVFGTPSSEIVAALKDFQPISNRRIRVFSLCAWNHRSPDKADGPVMVSIRYRFLGLDAVSHLRA